MASDQWQQVQFLFQRAVQLGPAERESFLSEFCGDNVELRGEVESLLECDRQASGGFMTPPPPEPGPAPFAEDAASRVGTEIGHYHIQRVIGTGGMGTVYEALQEQPQRLVALKMMHRAVVSRSALRRFHFESQVLARLNHRSIAQIFEAGIHADQTGDVPFFAMEYVQGAKSITEYAAEHGLNTRQRLQLLAAVCDAVHHGHQKGIIHRDLKPANILVDESGEPKVIDFGVARSTDSDLTAVTGHTHEGQLVGTMQYMSPEQCDADPQGLDLRSDVYSLGIVAYELLTGQRPYDASGTTIYRATRIIKEEIPQPLSKFDRKLRGDVETIVLKALEKDRERRYGSAADLARDVRSHLNGEPIEARPLTTWNRVVRWAARHPLGTTAIGCFMLIAATIPAMYLAVWFVNKRPANVVVLKRPGIENAWGGNAVELRSRNGNPLYTWNAFSDTGIGAAGLIDRPAELGGGRFALIAFRDRDAVKFPRSLCAFNVEQDYSTPDWEKKIETGELLPDPNNDGHKATDFVVGMFWVHDVFPEIPGDEIVATHVQGVHSQCFLRIYGLNGDVLYQVWYDGSISQCEWLPTAGLLVLGGNNAEAYAEDRGIGGGNRSHPYVLFALRPQLGLVQSAFLQSDPGAGPPQPAWIRTLEPHDSDLAKYWRIEANQPGIGELGRSLRMIVPVGDVAGGEVSWEVDENGTEIARSRLPSDPYRRNLMQHPPGDPRRLPDPSIFKLGDLPPIQAQPVNHDRHSR